MQKMDGLSNKSQAVTEALSHLIEFRGCQFNSNSAKLAIQKSWKALVQVIGSSGFRDTFDSSSCHMTNIENREKTIGKTPVTWPKMGLTWKWSCTTHHELNISNISAISTLILTNLKNKLGQAQHTWNWKFVGSSWMVAQLLVLLYLLSRPTFPFIPF